MISDTDLVVAKEHNKGLDEMKKCIRSWHNWFSDNNNQFHSARSFVFKTTLSDSDRSAFKELGMPELEFNALHALLMRQLGEFCEQEPSFVVSSEEDQVNPESVAVVEFVQAHLKNSYEEANKSKANYEVFKDLISGGFSAFKVQTAYRHEAVNDKAFDQDIFYERVDPTLCGWDQTSKDLNEGNYCFDVFYFTKKEFKLKYPNVNIDQIRFNSIFGEFNFSFFDSQHNEIVVVVDFYKKIKKNKRIVRLSNNKVMTKKEYNAMVEDWQDITFPPTVLEERNIEESRIHRYRLIENQVIEHDETDYTKLPIIYVDGHSAELRKGDSNSGQMYRHTIPMLYFAFDNQRLKNYSGSSLARSLESMVEQKWVAALEAIPKQYLDSYVNPQKNQTIIYNAYDIKNPDKQLPAPREVSPRDTPGSIINTFMGADRQTQTLVGNYDSMLGINNNEVSGAAIRSGAMNASATNNVYEKAFMNGLSRVARMIVDLIPKYYVTPRSVPVLLPNGDREYKKINQPGGINLMQVNTSLFKVLVTAGPSYALQKQQSLEMLDKFIRANPWLSEFIEKSPTAASVLFDNLDIRGADKLKLAYEEFFQQEQKAKQMAQQQAQNQMTPEQVKQMELQLKAKKDQQDFAINTAKVNNDNMQIQLNADAAHRDDIAKAAKTEAENFRSNIDIMLKASQVHHDITKGNQNA